MAASNDSKSLARRMRLVFWVFAVAGAVGSGGAIIAAFVYPAQALVHILLAAVMAVAGFCGAIIAVRERALLEAQRRAEAANEAKSNFLATVSHEFRTPLNGILGLTGLLLESRLTPEQETYARGVRSSGEALLHLVDEMLDFSRIEVGRFDLRSEPIDITALLQDIGELMATPAHNKAIDLAVDLAVDLPQSVLVDATRLRQVLVNLLDNAVKFTDVGGVILRAGRQPGAAAGNERIGFSVEDTGPGIDASETERIFGEFEQVERVPGRRHGGAGLGLAISRRIVRRMGGDIALSSRPGGGAKFSFALDLAVADSSRTQRERQFAGTVALIVSPGATEPGVLAHGLGDAGATVEIANDLDAALRIAGGLEPKTRPIEVVLVDQRVQPDPVTALQQLRTRAGKRLPAVILIEPGKRSALAALREAGFDAYLVRPVRRCSLVKIVTDVVSAPGLFRADPEDDRSMAFGRQSATAPLEVLLAEDNEINALLVRAVLESLGHRVTEVRNGAAAIDAVTDGKTVFSAILMDLHMPRVDGIAAAAVIRQFEEREGRPPAKILALTADVLDETRDQAIAAGIDAVLEKPISPETLRGALAGIASLDRKPAPQPFEQSAG